MRLAPVMWSSKEVKVSASAPTSRCTQWAWLWRGCWVGSKYVARDLQRLRELGVTHILNVAYGIPNAFTSVSQLYRVADSYMVYIT